MARKRTKPRTELRYTIGKGYHVSKQDAEALFAVIRDVFKGEYPRPEELVKEARKKRSPIHGLFEWDLRKIAAGAWRAKAQYYLRAIQIVVVNIDTSEVVKQPVRAFVPIRIDQGHRIPSECYIPTQRLHDMPAERGIVLERAKADFENWLRRYERYADFLEVFDPVIEAYRRAAKRIATAARRSKRA